MQVILELLKLLILESPVQGSRSSISIMMINRF
jgi:hypothetical protein